MGDYRPLTAAPRPHGAARAAAPPPPPAAVPRRQPGPGRRTAVVPRRLRHVLRAGQIRERGAELARDLRLREPADGAVREPQDEIIIHRVFLQGTSHYAINWRQRENQRRS